MSTVSNSNEHWLIPECPTTVPVLAREDSAMPRRAADKVTARAALCWPFAVDGGGSSALIFSAAVREEGR